MPLQRMLPRQGTLKQETRSFASSFRVPEQRLVFFFFFFETFFFGAEKKIINTQCTVVPFVLLVWEQQFHCQSNRELSDSVVQSNIDLRMRPTIGRDESMVRETCVVLINGYESQETGLDGAREISRLDRPRLSQKNPSVVSQVTEKM